MPIYEFCCQECGQVQEAICPVDQEVLEAGCTRCHGDMVRIPSPPGLAKLKTPAYGVL